MAKTSKAVKTATNSSIVPFLYNSSSMEELLNSYTSYLRKGSFADIIHANKLNEFHSILVDNDYFDLIRKNHENMFTYTKNTFKGLKFYLEGRRKALLGTEKKINLYIKEERPLDNFRDILAFRFIIFDDNIETCYNVMKMVIDFNVEQGFIPCMATKVFQTQDFNRNDFPGIVIPEKFPLDSDYKQWIKDYVIHPKKSGYQSLHVAFQDPNTGRFFEVQVRNFKMHIHAETKAGHEQYKKDRYSDIEIEFDRNKVNIDGYDYVDGQTFDFVGLEKPFQLIQKGKTI